MIGRILFLFILSFSLFDQTFCTISTRTYNLRPRINRPVRPATVYTNITPIVIENTEKKSFIKQLFNKTFGDTKAKKIFWTTIYTLSIFGTLKIAEHIWQPTEDSAAMWKFLCKTSNSFWKFLSIPPKWFAHKYSNITSLKALSPAELLEHEQCVNEESIKNLNYAINKAGRRADPALVMSNLREEVKRTCYLKLKQIKDCAEAAIEKYSNLNEQITTKDLMEQIKIACEDFCMQEITTK